MAISEAVSITPTAIPLMGPGLFGDVMNVILSGILTRPHAKLFLQSRFVGTPYTKAEQRQSLNKN
jgi:hypothetical protein